MVKRTTYQQKVQITKEYQNGFTIMELAKKYGLSRISIWRILQKTLGSDKYFAVKENKKIGRFGQYGENDLSLTIEFLEEKFNEINKHISDFHQRLCFLEKRNKGGK